MRRILTVAAAALVAGGAACTTVKTESRVTVDPIEVRPITVNVNATVDLVVRMKEEAGRTLDMIRGAPQSLLRWLLGASPAYAEEAETPYQAALRRQREYWPRVERWFDRGCVGWDNRALLAVRPCDGATAEEREEVRALVEEANRDYEAIYAGRAREKGLDEEATVVYRVQLAQEGRERARSGHWIQLPADRREFLNFKNTPLGERLAAAHESLAPGGWYRKP